jgi:hypothetical protein
MRENPAEDMTIIEARVAAIPRHQLGIPKLVGKTSFMGKSKESLSVQGRSST